MATLTINNSNIQRSYEVAHLEVTSPSGRTITIYKKNIGKFSPDETKVFWKFCKDPMVRFVGQMEASIEEMEILLKLSKI